MKKYALIFLGMFSLLYGQTGFPVFPNATDPAITSPNNAHIVYINTSVTPKNKLFVFLPGTGGVPAGYLEILKTAADQGYHAIGLMYPNAQTITSYCLMSNDSACYSKAREEVLDGSNHSDSLSVDRNNCIENRLIKLLKYLDLNYPSAGWGQYLVNDSTLTWTNFIVAGHSQGGGHAGFIGKVRPVDRVNMISSADWSIPFNRNGDWVYFTGLTPVSEYYGLIDKYDELISYSLEYATWTNMGLFAYGSEVKVDTAVTPYGCSHTLYSTILPENDTSQHHNSPVVDGFTPRDGLNNPLLKPVWIYMMEGCPFTSVDNILGLDFTLYPNPSAAVVYVTAETPFQYMIYDLFGREVQTGYNGSDQIDLRISAGMYILRIINSKGMGSVKLMVEK